MTASILFSQNNHAQRGPSPPAPPDAMIRNPKTTFFTKLRFFREKFCAQNRNKREFCHIEKDLFFSYHCTGGWGGDAREELCTLDAKSHVSSVKRRGVIDEHRWTEKMHNKHKHNITKIVKMKNLKIQFLKMQKLISGGCLRVGWWGWWGWWWWWWGWWW